MMALNRYKLKHRVKQKDKKAIRVFELLSRPDRLIGVILIGNNLVNNLAVSITTVIAIRMWPANADQSIYVATILLTFIILIFSEVTPKTLASIHPERIAFPAAYILKPLLKLLLPAVWIVNGIANGLLKISQVKVAKSHRDDLLSTEELRTVVNEAGGRLPGKRQSMLLSVLDLEKVTVNDIMIPRNEVVGIDIEADLDDIIEILRRSEYTRLPVYKGDINDPIGLLHLKRATRFLSKENFTKEDILKETREAYFIPENTPLHLQLVHFQKEKRRMGLVVDEYGDIQGIATLEDILEEIVGEFTSDITGVHEEVEKNKDGSYTIKGTANIREVNKVLHWDLPIDGPKTLSGLIIETLESIPKSNVCLKIGAYNIEVTEIKGNTIESAKIHRVTPISITSGTSSSDSEEEPSP